MIDGFVAPLGVFSTSDPIPLVFDLNPLCVGSFLKLGYPSIGRMTQKRCRYSPIFWSRIDLGCITCLHLSSLKYP